MYVIVKLLLYLWSELLSSPYTLLSFYCTTTTNALHYIKAWFISLHVVYIAQMVYLIADGLSDINMTHMIYVYVYLYMFLENVLGTHHASTHGGLFALGDKMLD